ncbi:hypothetical protein B4U79_10068 [Dinothrombium tinctorium]|uniref:Uncharacterized protein n=1 Tax=Dinothrombium tinctorium TaxID=1965070 RepID=A0A3S4R2T8_9ACAR|nr:hypothetical protein B4U79_11892 [Dinothrombium tinctorium]RWS10823.1 hypothetical protein B4U79_13261 [Dinothrombium tinctorium]RWS10831.1 hypothetical protein B4U79_10068 [Dinothrombium tinctorium]
MVPFIHDKKNHKFLKRVFLQLIEVNSKKCPGYRQVAKVNCLLVFLFAYFVSTWIAFYLTTCFMFLGLNYALVLLVK